jgi:hypothetical protein
MCAFTGTCADGEQLIWLTTQAIHRRISRKNQARAGISGQTALASKRVAFTKRSTFA